jgi:hypothetical protein
MALAAGVGRALGERRTSRRLNNALVRSQVRELEQLRPRREQLASNTGVTHARFPCTATPAAVPGWPGTAAGFPRSGPSRRHRCEAA